MRVECNECNNFIKPIQKEMNSILREFEKAKKNKEVIEKINEVNNTIKNLNVPV